MNTNRKEEFRENSTQFFLPTILHAIDVYEDKIGKDICDFSLEEFEEFLRSKNSRSVDFIKSVIFAAQEYAKYCYNAGYTENKLFEHKLNPKNYIAISRHITKQEIYKFAAQCLNDSDAALLIGTYEGLRSIDFALIEKNMFNGNKLTLPDRTVDVSDIFLHYALDAIDCYVRYAVDEKEYPLDKKDPHIVKRKVSRKRDADVTADQIVRRINSTWNRLFLSMDPRLSRNNIRKSAMRDLIHDYLEKNIELDDKFISWMLNQYDIKDSADWSAAKFYHSFYYEL